MSKQECRECQNAAWKFWLPAALFGVASFGGWVLGDKPPFPDWMGLSLLITLKASPLLQSDLCYVAQVWVEKQIVVLSFFNMKLIVGVEEVLIASSYVTVTVKFPLPMSS